MLYDIISSLFIWGGFMELSKERISLMDNQELLELVMPSVNNVFNNYSYLNLDKDNQIKIVESAINKSRENYNGNIPYIKYLDKIIKLFLEKYTSMQFNNQDKILKLLNNYLLSLPPVNNIYDALNNLNQLELFLKKYDYEINKDIIINLLSISEQFTLSLNYLMKEKYEKNDNNSPFIKLIINTWYEEVNKDLYGNYENRNGITSYQEYLHDIVKVQLLSEDEEKRLFKEFRNGNISARDKIIEGNLRLVLSIANNYRHCSVPVEDLIQEGNIGLVYAVNKFREYENCKFSTFAYICIKSFIIRAIRRKGRIIRLPDYCYVRLLKYKTVKYKLEDELERKVTIEELAEYLNVPVDTVSRIYYSQYELISTNEKISDEDDDELEKNLVSDSLGPDDLTIQKDFKNNIQKLFELADLSEKAIDIIKSRFGFNNNRIYTLDEIGKKYGITRERVRQLEEKALKKMRKAATLNGYKCYISDSDEYKERRK